MKEITVNLKCYNRIKYTKAKQIQIIESTREMTMILSIYVYISLFN